MDLQTVFVIFGGGMFALLVAWAAWQTAYFLGEAKSTWKAIAALKDDLANYKQSVAEKFASGDDVRAVEERLVKALNDLTGEFRKFTQTFQDHLVSVAARAGESPRGRTKKSTPSP